MMNKFIGYIGLLLLLGLVHAAFAQDLFDSFEVSGGSGRVEVNWTTTSENSIRSFAVERSTDGIEYFPIATFTAQGNNSKYRYIDVDIFKDTRKTFYYRIKAYKLDNTTFFSESREITVQLSNIQQTWGSLKAMFR